MILDSFSLKGKVAIVTGSRRGIGKAILKAFAEVGADLVCNDLVQSDAEATAAEIRAMGRKCLAIACDVRDRKQVEALVSQTVDKFGRIDILVNNAATGTWTSAMAITDSQIEDDLRGGLASVLICCQSVAKVMIGQKSGSIINISSRESQMPSTGLPVYGAAKAGVNSLTKTLAWELKPYVRVNAILPGCIWTEQCSAALGPLKGAIEDATPVKRVGKPEDIALAALYLASSASDFVTGKLLEVDGGMEFTYNLASNVGKESR